MRRTEKQQAERVVDLLGQAHREIIKAIERKQGKVAMDLLEQCQTAAIELGNMIETKEGEGCITVRFLEDYCELLYRIHEKIRIGKLCEPGKEFKVLRRLFIQIENSVRNDITARYEAVFLPYKASMWDSLESVWRAADEDLNCDVYVIPIPYYDRNSDGNLGEMHYEGGLYPDYVPVTGYMEYDFAKHLPDMIFIHNPYDECNYVTSVHPFFYSKNLKQFTDQLIYIPYFILGEISPENKEAVDGIKHFCVTPGVINASKVIVQSEVMRQVYVEVMTEAAGEDSRVYWENKILGLGSPKMDKVASTRREEIEIPEEWRNIIVKPDGNRKKIIFYNTGISALLRHGKRMQSKIRDVLEFFRENQEKVVLLWRPHPLIKATIESMRPELWEGYQEMVDQYRREGWGIYDDTADIDRAIAISDAYYGDWSSVVHLYQETGKPVMIQKAGIIRTMKNGVYLRPAAMNMVEGERKIWMALLNRNGICEIDKETHRAVIRKKFEGEPINKEWLYSFCEKFNHYLIFSPSIAKNIAIYNLKNDSITYISLKKLDRGFKQNQENSKFWNILCHNSDTYFFGYSYPAIIKINMDSMVVTYITDWVKDVEKSIEYRNNNGYFGDGYIIIDNIALIPVSCMSAVLELDLKTNNTRLRELNIPMEGIGGLSSIDGNNIWLVGKGSGANIVCHWNIEKDEMKQYEVLEENICDPFYAPVCTPYKIFLIPISASHIYEIDSNTKEIRKLTVNTSSDRGEQLWPDSVTMAPRLRGEWLIYLTCEDLKWHEYNVVTGESQEYFIELEENSEQLEKYFEVIYAEAREKAETLSEIKISLEFFVNMVLKTKDIILHQLGENDLVGTKIYEQAYKSLL